MQWKITQFMVYKQSVHWPYHLNYLVSLIDIIGRTPDLL